MRLQRNTTILSLVIVLSLVSTNDSFTPSLLPCLNHRHSVGSSSSEGTKIGFQQQQNNNDNVVVLYSTAAEDFVKKQQEAARAKEEEELEELERPQLFSDDIMEDMRTSLLTLERRTKEGPGCLTHGDIDEFAMAAGRVLRDMKAQGKSLPDRIRPGERRARAEAAAEEAAINAEEEGKSSEEIELIAREAYDAATKGMIPPPTESIIQEDTTSDEDGPAYDGTGGMGLAKGTANTYDIPGMDEMTADEYQEALAQAVIDRATKRRYGMGGRHGNQQTNDYMQSLSVRSNLKSVNPFNKQKDDDEEEEEPGRYDANQELQLTNDYMASIGGTTTNPFNIEDDDKDDDDADGYGIVRSD